MRSQQRPPRKENEDTLPLHSYTVVGTLDTLDSIQSTPSRGWEAEGALDLATRMTTGVQTHLGLCHWVTIDKWQNLTEQALDIHVSWGSCGDFTREEYSGWMAKSLMHSAWQMGACTHRPTCPEYLLHQLPVSCKVTSSSRSYIACLCPLCSSFSISFPGTPFSLSYFLGIQSIFLLNVALCS